MRWGGAVKNISAGEIARVKYGQIMNNAHANSRGIYTLPPKRKSKGSPREPTAQFFSNVVQKGGGVQTNVQKLLLHFLYNSTLVSRNWLDTAVSG